MSANEMTRDDAISVLRGQNINLFEIPARYKKATQTWKKWQTEYNNDPIPDGTNYAVVCGEVSDNLIVVDIDHHGEHPELVDQIFADAKNKTLVVETGSKGHHIYFKAHQLPKSGQIHDDRNIGIDVQSNGRYVVGAGSIHPNGNEYNIVSTTTDITVVDFKKITDKLWELGFRGSVTKRQAGVPNAQGTRHVSLIAQCNRVRQNFLDFEDFVRDMQRWNRQFNNPPLPDEEVSRACDDTWNYQEPPEIGGEEGERPTTRAIVEAILFQGYHFRAYRDTEEVLYYEDGVYVSGGEFKIKELVLEVFPDAKISDRKEVVDLIRIENGVDREDFDKNYDEVNFKNGIYNINTKEFEEHSPKRLFRVQHPVTYDPNARCPEILKFLVGSLMDKDRIITAIEQVATCFVKEPLWQKAYLHTGSGSNGKSVWLSVIQKALGVKSVSTVSIHELANDAHAPANLVGKVANICADIESEEISRTGTIKKVISGDGISANPKMQKRFNVFPFAKFFFSANQIPALKHGTSADYRRFMIIPWEVTFDKERRDVNLLQKLTTEEELAGFVRMCLENIPFHGFRYEKNMEEMKQDFEQYTDSVKNFIQDCCVLRREYAIPTQECYSEYIQNCKERVEKPVPPNVFGRRFEMHTGATKTREKVRSGRAMVYHGVTTKKNIKEINKSGGQETL